MRTALVGLVGLWVGLLLAAGAAATLNFRTVDRALGPQSAPELRDRLAPLAEVERRAVLRHAASESNRSLFALSGWTQAVLALLVLALAWPVGRLHQAAFHARCAFHRRGLACWQWRCCCSSRRSSWASRGR